MYNVLTVVVQALKIRGLSQEVRESEVAGFWLASGAIDDLTTIGSLMNRAVCWAAPREVCSWSAAIYRRVFFMFQFA